jgi:hypothetical protein
MKILAQLFISLVVLVVGTLVGVYIEKYNAEENGKIRFLDYKINKSNLLNTPVIQGRTLEVLLDKSPIKKISHLEVILYNFSDQDYEKIPVYLELSPNDGEKYSLVAAEAVGAGGIPETIETITVSESKNSDTYRAAYEIKTVNRNADRETYVLSITFLITGDIPNVNIRIDKKGVKSREYSYLNYINQDQTLNSILALLLIIGLIVGAIVSYVLVIYVAGKFLKGAQQKQQEKFRSWLIGRLASEEIVKELHKDNSEEELANTFIKLIDEHRWISTKQEFLRKLLSMEKPEHLSDERANAGKRKINMIDGVSLD